MRLFLGFAPGAAETRQIFGRAELLRLDPATPMREVPTDNWHVTLLFLGEVREANLPVLMETTQQVASETGSLKLCLDEMGWFPDVSKARLLALCGQPSEGLMALHDGLAAQLRREGFHIERRAYRPHLTLARYRGARKAFTPPPLPLISPFTLDLAELTLFESVLGGKHPRYQALQPFGLAA